MGAEKETGFPQTLGGNDKQEKAPADYQVGFICTVLKTMVRGHLRQLRLNSESFNVEAIINPTEVRNGLIRARFISIRENGETVMENYELLGKQFGLCDETIKQIVSGRR